MAPDVHHMTDRQRRWWFAQLAESNEEDRRNREGQEVPDPFVPLPNRDKRLAALKEYHRGMNDGWASVTGKRNVDLSGKDPDGPYTAGFTKGVTDGKRWVNGMTRVAETLGGIVRKVADALRTPPTLPTFPLFPGTIKTPRQRDKAIRSLQKQIRKHEQKLADYTKDPYAHDNTGFLRNAATPELRREIYESRVKSLKGQIEGFKQRITKIKQRGE